MKTILKIVETRLEIDGLDIILGKLEKKLCALQEPERELSNKLTQRILYLQLRIDRLKDLILLRRKQFVEWLVEQEGKCLMPKE
jgi:hypothetical protein